MTTILQLNSLSRVGSIKSMRGVDKKMDSIMCYPEEGYV